MASSHCHLSHLGVLPKTCPELFCPSRHIAGSLSVCLENCLLIGFEFFVYLKNQISVSHSGSPRRRLSAMCSCQETLARSRVFPKGFDTWYSRFSLTFNLWCFPEPLQVVDCAAFSLCAKNVPSSAQICSPQRYQWAMAACGSGRGDGRIGNGSLDWRALLGCQAGLHFQKR